MRRSTLDRRDLQRVLGASVKPRDTYIYREAVIHRSMERDMGGISQERLEFLGDAVLHLCTSDILHFLFPNSSEGTLSKIRTTLIAGKLWARIGRSMYLETVIIISPNLMPLTDKVYEDTVEALIGAIYLDLGLDAAKKFVRSKLEGAIDYDELIRDTNYKKVLMQLVAPAVVTFTTTVALGSSGGFSSVASFIARNGRRVEAAPRSVGPSKKDAEMMAAKAAIEMLGVDAEKASAIVREEK